MKRLLTIGLMLASAFALTNCAEEIAAPVQDDVTVDGNIENITPPEEEVNIPFDVFANFAESADTKTYTLGNHTYWDSGDKISVFHKPQGATDYNLNNDFTLADVRTGQFSGSLTKALGQTNDWYFIYPSIGSGSSSGTTPESLTVTIGKDEWTDVEAGSKNHIDGDFAPMYGKKTLAINEQPEITMNHLAAVVAIKFVNMSAGEIKVKRAEFGIPEITSGKDKQDGIKIAGDFTVDFTGNTLSFTPTDNSSTKVIAKLSQYKPVSNEGEITIYMPVRPFKAVEGTCVEVSLNGSSKMVKLTEDVNFEAGKVTTLRVTIPTLKGTLSSAITKNGTTFVDWGENTSYDQVSINGTEGIDLYTVNNGQITISGKISEFLGTETGNGVLPLSFFASSKVSIDDSGSIISSPATLSLNSLYVNVINVADVLIEGSALEESIGINVTFNPVLLGDYGIENIIIIDEERAHYSIDEDKANRLIKDGLAGSEKFNKRTIHTDIKATDYDLALFRSAMFKMDQAAWEKLFKLAQVMAPGQFSEYNKQDDTLLGKLLRGCADSSWKGSIYRGTVTVAISLATMEVTLITNGEVAMWGMNIYGGE